MPRNNSVFHYTNFDGLLGIIGGKKFFATHVNYLDDNDEFEYSRRWMIENFDILKQKVEDLSSFPEHLSDRILGPIPNFNYYALSFSKHTERPKKSGILSQWKYYGGLGGVAIEFDWPSLVNKLEMYSDNNDLGSFFSSVNYSDKKLEQEIVKICNEGYRYRVSSGGKGEYFHETGWRALIYGSSKILGFHKHPSFFEEKEYRALFLGYGSEVKELFRVKGNALIPYIEVGGDDLLTCVKSVMVGPSADQERVYEAVRRFIGSQELNIKVTSADTPLKVKGV